MAIIEASYLSICVSVWRKWCKTKTQSLYVMLPVALWLAWCRRAQGAQRLPARPGNPVLGLSESRRLKCSMRSYHGHPSCDTAAEILLKSDVALNSQSPLPTQCQASQPSSQTYSPHHLRQGGWNEAVWNCGEWGWTWSTVCGAGDTCGNPKCLAAILYTTSFLLLMVQEGLCCGGNAVKSFVVLMSPAVLLCNGSSEHLE